MGYHYKGPGYDPVTSHPVTSRLIFSVRISKLTEKNLFFKLQFLDIGVRGLHEGSKS
jgi:hypothetical protein